jgi:hypothetical protein
VPAEEVNSYEGERAVLAVAVDVDSGSWKPNDSAA